MKALIEADMKSVDVATSDGRTALHVAAKRGNAEAVKLLVKRQANANSKRLFVSYPFEWHHLAVAKNCITGSRCYFKELLQRTLIL